jgi:hypothetical protein
MDNALIKETYSRVNLNEPLRQAKSVKQMSAMGLFGLYCGLDDLLLLTELQATLFKQAISYDSAESFDKSKNSPTSPEISNIKIFAHAHFDPLPFQNGRSTLWRMYGKCVY